ncbi:MAG TPA: NUDIX hydrolase [Thermoplasmata archaeon]|nr:NUDIX hydrolase [Thermoplasmata archaeon]
MPRPLQVHPWVTVDGLLLVEAKLAAVLRRNPPFQGMPALPGGFLELGETTEQAVVREVREETGLETRVSHLVGVFSDPARDPRGHTVTAAYALERTGGELRAGSDAKGVALLDPERLPPMAFDHARIVASWRSG